VNSPPPWPPRAHADRPATRLHADQLDPKILLARLRSEFPLIGIIADPAAHLWMAIGGGIMCRASTGIELREQIMTAGLRGSQ
jgi:hypothetical protein